MPRARLMVLLALVALGGFPGTAGAVLSGINGRIVFATGRDTGDGTANLYTRTIVGDAGGGQAFLATAPVGGEQQRHPSWSPDRTRVVYAQGPSNDWNIHIRDLTDLGDTTITSTSDQVFSDRPAWSPDGTKIAWEDEATNNSGQQDIVVYNVATGTKTNLTQTAAVEGKPAWSPDSKTIYYSKGDAATNGQNIYARPAAGGPETVNPVVADTSLNEYQPSVSPDGTKMCFTVSNGPPSAEAEVMVAPLTNPPSAGTVLTADDGPPNGPNKGNYNCTWSPDGRFIAYVRGIFGNGDLVMEKSDLSDFAPITLENTPARFDGNPDWAPDGPPECDDTKTQQVRQGKTITIKLPCHDTGPAYERTDVTETVPGDAGPFHGKVGPVTQGNPSTVKYTANAKYSGPDSFEFAGLGINGGNDRGLASILVLKNGACANMKTGNEKPNKIDGTIAGDRLLGLGAKDTLRGFRGNDCLFGGAGPDTLEGGPDKDRLSGEKGKDVLIGGGANDRLNGGEDKDRFDGGRGNDRINAADGHAEDVKCGAGKDDRATVDEDDTVHGCEHVTRK